MRRLRIGWLISSSLGVFLSCVFQADAADLTITVRDMLHDPRGDHTSQTTSYLTTDRKRIEYSGGSAVVPGDLPKGLLGSRMAKIQDCKTGTEYDVNPDTREYTEIVPGNLTLEELRASVEAERVKIGPDQQGPTSTVEVETKDTGERQAFFGYIARHVVTTRRYLLPQGKHWVDETSDGWYVDLPVTTECKVLRFTPASVQQVLELSKRGIEEYKMVGKPETGYPVKLKNTERIYHSRLDGSSRDSTVTKRELEVIEISDHPLARSLFDVPAGFKRLRRTTRNPAIPPEILRTSIEERE